MNKDFWIERHQELYPVWERHIIYDAGMTSIIAQCKQIPIQDLKKFLLTKLSKKRVVLIFLFFGDYSEIKEWEPELKKKYGKNYIELLYEDSIHRLIFLNGGGALISPRRHAKKGIAYLYC